MGSDYLLQQGNPPEPLVTVEVVARAKVPASQAAHFAESVVQRWTLHDAEEWEITQRIVPKK